MYSLNNVYNMYNTYTIYNMCSKYILYIIYNICNIYNIYNIYRISNCLRPSPPPCPTAEGKVVLATARGEGESRLSHCAGRGGGRAAGILGIVTFSLKIILGGQLLGSPPVVDPQKKCGARFEKVV